MERTTKAIIEKVVRARFDNVEIVDVQVDEGLDHDGDEVLFVRIVFSGEVEELKAERMSGLIRHLRSNLAKRQEFRFPHTSYIAKNKIEGAAA